MIEGNEQLEQLAQALMWRSFADLVAAARINLARQIPQSDMGSDNRNLNPKNTEAPQACENTNNDIACVHVKWVERMAGMGRWHENG